MIRDELEEDSALPPIEDVPRRPAIPPRDYTGIRNSALPQAGTAGVPVDSDMMRDAMALKQPPPSKEHWYSGVGSALGKGAAELGGQVAGAGEYVAGRVLGPQSPVTQGFSAVRGAADDAVNYWQQSMTPEQQAEINSQWTTLDPTKTIWQGGPSHFFHALTLQTAQGIPAMMVTMLPATAWAKVGATGKALAYIGATQAGLSMGQIANNISNEIAQTPEDQLRAQSPQYSQLIDSGMDPAAARQKLTQDAQRYAPVLGGVITGAISTLAGRFLSPVLSKEGQTLGARLAGGAADQGIQGAAGQGAAYLASEAAASTYDKTRSPTLEGFADQAIEGGVTGAVQGAAFGAIAGKGHEQPHSPPQDAFGENDVHQTMGETHVSNGETDEYTSPERNREGFDTLEGAAPSAIPPRVLTPGQQEMDLPQGPRGVAPDIAAALQARTSDVGHWNTGEPTSGYQGGAAPPAAVGVDLQGRNGMQEPNGPQGNLDLRGGQMNNFPGPTPPANTPSQMNLPFEQRQRSTPAGPETYTVHDPIEQDEPLKVRLIQLPNGAVGIQHPDGSIADVTNMIKAGFSPERAIAQTHGQDTTGAKVTRDGASPGPGGRQRMQPMTSAPTEYTREEPSEQTVGDALRQRQAQRADVNQPDLFRDQPSQQPGPPRSAGGTLTTPENRPMVRGTADSPSPEPYGDLAAQMRDLADPQHPRTGVYLSADNLESARQRGVLDRLRQEGGEESVPLLNFDRKGGVLIAKNDQVAQELTSLRDQKAANMQEILGEATGAGRGKPSEGQLVVQQHDDQGNVTRETGVQTQQEAEALARQYNDVARGRTASITTAPAAVLRRAALVGRESEITGRQKAERDTATDVRSALHRNVGADREIAERAEAAAGRDLETGAPSPARNRGEAARRLASEARNIHNEERSRPGAGAAVPDPRDLKFVTPDAAARYQAMHNEWVGAQVMEGTPNTAHPEYTEKGVKGREILERQIARFLNTHQHEFRARPVGRAALELDREAVREHIREPEETEARESNPVARETESIDAERPDVMVEGEETPPPAVLPHPRIDTSYFPPIERKTHAEVHALMKDDPTTFAELYNQAVEQAARSPRSKLTKAELIAADRGNPSQMEKRINRYFRSREATESLSGAKSKPMLVSESRPLTDEEINQNRNRKETGKPKVTGFKSLKPESLIATVPSQKEMERRASSPKEARAAAKERFTQLKSDVRAGEGHLKELIALKKDDLPEGVGLFKAQKYMRDLLQYGRVLRDQGLQSPDAIRAAKQFTGLIKSLGKMSAPERAAYLGKVFDAEFRNQNRAAALVSPDSLTHFKDLPEVVAKANKTLEQNRVAREEFRKALAESPTAEDAFIKKMDAEIERDRLRDLADERNLAMGTIGARAPERRTVEPTGLHDSVISAMMAADPRITEGKSVSLSELHNEAHGQMGDKQIHDEIAHLIAEGLLVPKKTNVGRPLTPREKYLQYEDAQGNKYNKVMLHPGLVERLQNRFVERGISNEDTYIPERAPRAVTPEDLAGRPTSRGVFSSPEPGNTAEMNAVVRERRLGDERQDMTWTPEQRAARRAMVSAERAREEGFSGDLDPEPIPRNAAEVEGEAARRDAMSEDELAAYDARNRLPNSGETQAQLQARLDAEAAARGSDTRTREEFQAAQESQRAELRQALKVPTTAAGLRRAAAEFTDRLEQGIPIRGFSAIDAMLKHLPPESPFHDLFQTLKSKIDPRTYVGYAGAREFSSPTTFGSTELHSDGPRIRINRDQLESMRANGQSPELSIVHTLAHEMVHAATAHAIYRNEGLRGELQGILRTARDAGSAKEHYGLTDINEMVAEAFSNRRFQDFLKNVKIPGAPDTLWQRFKRMVGNAIGKDWGSKSHDTAFDAIMRNHDELFSGKRYATTPGEIARMKRLELNDAEGSRVGNGVDRLMKSLKLEKSVVSRLADRVSDSTSNAGQFQLSAMTPRQMRAQYGHHFEQADGANPYTRYWDTYFKRAADNAVSMEKVGKHSNNWSNLEEKYGNDMAHSVSKLMHDASIYGFHPDRPITDESNDHLTSPEQKARHTAGQKLYDSLPADWKQQYQSTRNYYARERQNSSDQMVLNGLHAMLTKGEGAAMTAKEFDSKYSTDSIRKLGLDTSDGLKKEFGDNLSEANRGILEKVAAFDRRPGPYFPLMRDGDYVVTSKRQIDAQEFEDGKTANAYAQAQRAKDPTLSVSVRQTDDGTFRVVTNEKEVRMAETKSQAARHRAEMAATYGEENTSPVQLKADYYKSESGITTGSALDSLMRKLDGNPAAQAAIKDFYLKSLGDSSFRKRELTRQNVRGVDVQNQHRAFTQYGRSQSYYLAQLKYGRHLANAQAEVNKVVGAHRDESQVSAVRMGQFAKELALRDEISRNPYEVSDIVKKGTSLTQFMMITSPSHWFVRGAQPYVLSAPWLGARHGMTESVSALGRAQRMIADPLVTESINSAAGLKALFSRAAAEKSYSVIDDVLAHINRTAGADAPKITAMVQKLRENNLIDLSMATELSDIAKGKSTGLTSRVLDSSRIMLHLIEVNNRVMTAIAARELGLKKGMTEEQAYEHAVDAINVTHNDYSYGNTPRLFMAQAKGVLGGARPLMFQFMKYPQQVYGMMISSTLQALKGKTQAERTTGVKTLVGMLATHMLAAGAVGVTLQPIKWAIGAAMAGAAALGYTDGPYTVANALSGDTADQMIREVMNDLFGTEMGELVSKGLPTAIGLDLSQRMALGTTYQFHLKTDSDASTIGSLVQTFGGPWLNVGTNMYDAGKNFLAGKPLDAIQQMSPHIIRDLVKAGMMSQNGLTNNAGNTLIPAEQLSAGEIFARSLGFQPDAIAEVQNRNNAERETEMAIIDHRKALLAQVASGDPDVRAEARNAIAEFNQAHPGFAIDGSAQLRALAKKQADDRELQQYGIKARAKQLPELSRAGGAYNVGS